MKHWMLNFTTALGVLGILGVLCMTSFVHSATAAENADKANTPEEEGLLVPVYVARATPDSVVLDIIGAGSSLAGTVRYRPEGSKEWATFSIPAGTPQIFQAHLEKLKAGTRYEFEVLDASAQLQPQGQGVFTTQRTDPAPFSFVAMTDAHINPSNPERDPILRALSDTATLYKPDLVLHLGDNIQTVGSTHGGPAQHPSHTPHFYLYWRNALGKLQAQAAQYVLNGNWEGENGWHPEPNRTWARDARMLLAPAPDNALHPEGGSKDQDYYAFTWGDALFVTLNVTGYNTINHEHTNGPGRADDWTLGKDQYEWLEKTLANSKATWKFIFIHHAVGGNAGDDVNSRYGRGGGRAAQVGEQAKVHALLKKYNVPIFFYGHDHVFTDMEVDGIHYICAGGAGAPWKFATDETGYENYIPESGFTLVDINGDKASVSYIKASPTNPKGEVLYKLELKAK